MDLLFAGIAVADFGAALAWYEQLLGRPADIIVKDDEVMWRIADAAWLYVTGDPSRSGHALVTVAVADLDETVALIEDRGLRSAPIETIAGAGRKAAFTDPEGNMTTFIEVVASGH
jgi:predicted enzyme related to lactoylglutathione lyase